MNDEAPSAPSPGLIAIGELARRSGVAASAIRFYETQGLLASHRSAAGRRLFARGDLRRVAFIRAAQAVGLSLEQIAAALAGLPQQRTPTKADWERLSSGWKPLLDERIAALSRLRDQLGACIGCGCLSLKSCALYNPADAAAARGSGPRYLLGDRAAEVLADLPAAQPARPPRPPIKPRAGSRRS
jgi:MerR family redox-sensitive transcriptional activator SoxR